MKEIGGMMIEGMTESHFVMKLEEMNEIGKINHMM